MIADALLALAGLDAGSAFGGMGGSRAVAVAALVANPGHLMAFVAFFIVLIAETGRLPVDNTATHLELTMIHEAMALEYSLAGSFALGLFPLAAVFLLR